MIKNPKFSLLPLLALLCAICSSGCLTAERKELILTVKPDGSGTARMTFFNIQSVEEEGKDNSLSDYTDLVSVYLKGTKFEDYYPQYTNFRKRVFEENGKLNGEIIFDFIHYEDIGMYRYQNVGPWMYYVGTKTDFGIERYDSSSGTFASEEFPVVFWPDSTTEFRISSTYDNADMAKHSLVALYKRVGIN